jgi:hypothetical protein
MNALTDFSRDVDQQSAGFRSVDAIVDYTPGLQCYELGGRAGWAGTING